MASKIVKLHKEKVVATIDSIIEGIDLLLKILK